MRSNNLKTKIFLDCSDTNETTKILELLGFLDGQTTNPSNMAKSPTVKTRLDEGKKFSREEIYQLYKKTIQDISKILPNGSVSVEVYADANTPTETIFKQGLEMNKWIPNAHIKLPITKNGLEAAEQFVQMGININVTLVFNQEQAAAVYAATRGAKPGQVFISPFVGRLDGRGENGVELIKNIVKMYSAGDGHVQVLAASIRNLDNLLGAISVGADIITTGFSVLQNWQQTKLMVPDQTYIYPAKNLKEVPYQEISLDKNWREYNIQHELTDKGLEMFCNDWNGLIE